MGLVTELAVILIAAGIFTIISKALKQPLILGYIVAGFIVSPNLGLLPELGGTDAVKEWSDIGIIFLLFALGLEFSFKKLIKVGSGALIAAGTKCIGMFIIGMTAGEILGWSAMESVFLGGLMSMSSTTIIIKAYDEMGLKNKPYAPQIFGSLVVEDIIAVLLMVLLSTMAVSNNFAGKEMIWSILKLVFYIILWFLSGIYFIPILLDKSKKWLNDEILLILSIGLCFGMVVLANAAGFSSALGAFVMGSILSETLQGERINKLMLNIKNLFGAIFFVSVGMMIDPAVIAAHWPTIIFITIIAMAGIVLCSTTGALLAGKGLDTAVHAGFTLAQLGEFSFIIASLGCSLGVMRDYLYPVIISVSVITTFTTPYMIRAADPVVAWLKGKLPERILSRLTPGDEPAFNSIAERSEWKVLMKSYALRVVLYGVVIVAVILFSGRNMNTVIMKFIPSIDASTCNIINFVITVLISLPLMYGMSISNGSIGTSVKNIVKKKRSNIWIIISLMVLRILLSVFFMMCIIVQHFHLKGWASLIVPVCIAILFFVAKFVMRKYSFIEEQFIRNLNVKDAAEKKMSPVASSVKEKLSLYDVRTETITVSPDFQFIGKTLREMPFRKASGVNIIKIVRGSKSVVIPSGDEYIYPGDILVAVGTGSQLKEFNSIIEDSTNHLNPEPVQDFSVETATLGEESYLVGKSLAELSMRSHGCMVICVLRHSDLITNPHADFTFCSGDTVWLAGETASCRWYM